MYYNIFSNGYISSKQAGIGFKGKRVYACYNDDYIISWAKSWDNTLIPEDFGYQKLPNCFQFDYYINFETGEIK